MLDGKGPLFGSYLSFPLLCSFPDAGCIVLDKSNWVQHLVVLWNLELGRKRLDGQHQNVSHQLWCFQVVELLPRDGLVHQ